MNAALLLLALTALVRTGPSRVDPARVDDHAQPTTETPKEIVQRLAKETKHLKAFTANYRGVSKSKEFTLRIAYGSPDKARFQLGAPAQSISVWILDGHFFMRGDFDDGPRKADFDYRAAFKDGSGFDEVFAREFFPGRPDPDDLGSGASFLLWPSLKDSTKSFDLRLEWVSARQHFLRWLDEPADWADAKHEGDELVRTLEDGSVVALSTRTGFIERMQRPDGSHEELVDFKESSEDADFNVSEPKPGAQEVMTELAADKPMLVGSMRRLLVCLRMTKEKETTSDEFKMKLSRVFVALLSPEVKAHYERIEETFTARTERFAGWCSHRFIRTAGDAAARKELESEIAKRRTSYAEQLAAELQNHGLDDPRFAELGLDPKLLSRLSVIEHDAHGEVVQRVATAPFLAKFDEAITAAKNWK
jgi:hypothetical protein